MEKDNCTTLSTLKYIFELKKIYIKFNFILFYFRQYIMYYIWLNIFKCKILISKLHVRKTHSIKSNTWKVKIILSKKKK